MPKPFRIKHLEDIGRWVPEDRALDEMAFFVDDGKTPRRMICKMLYDNIESMMPGEYVLDESIEDARQEVFARIDAKTDQFIERGFDYRGIRFSSSLYAQSRYHYMQTSAIMQLSTGDLTKGLQYPLVFNSLDDTQSLRIDGPDEVLVFCESAADYLRDQVDSAFAFKDAARNATTQEELDAIRDTREEPGAPPAEPEVPPETP